MTWQAPLRATCLFCHEAKEEPKPAKVFRESKLKYCILCYVEEGVSICRKCLVPWQAAYDSNNAFSKELRFARAEDEPYMLCLECVREDMENEQQLTLPPCALNDQAHLQLEKIRTVVAQFGQHPIQVLASQSLASWLGAPADLPAHAEARDAPADLPALAPTPADPSDDHHPGAERQPASQITTTTLFVHPRIIEASASQSYAGFQ